MRGLNAEDRRIFAAIAEILQSARRSRTVTLCQRNIIVLESSRGERRRVPGPRAARAASVAHRNPINRKRIRRIEE